MIFKCFSYYLERRLCESIHEKNDKYIKASIFFNSNFTEYKYTIYDNLKGVKKGYPEHPLYTLSVIVKEEFVSVHLIKICYDFNNYVTIISHIFRAENEEKDQNLYEEVADSIISEVMNNGKK